MSEYVKKKTKKTGTRNALTAVLLLFLTGLVLLTVGCDLLGLTDDDDGGSGGGGGGGRPENHIEDFPAVVFGERDSQGRAAFDLHVDQDAEVYFVFTNTTVDQQKSAPTLVSGLVPERRPDPLLSRSQTAPAPKRPRLPDIPYVQEFNRDPERFISQDVSGGAFFSPQSYSAPQMSYTVDNTEDFHTYTKGTITATLKSIHDGDGYRLLIWQGPDSDLKTEELESIEQDFATIFPRMIHLFGPQWGTAHNDARFIEYTDDIHILYYDMPYGGYFWSLNNYKATVNGAENSNEKIMFYMHENGAGMDYSVLAHEFQHLIHFYQKRLINAGSTDNWFNEMMSMAAEDILADVKPNPGPRGVGLDDGLFRYAAQDDYLPSISRPSEFLFNTNTPLTFWLSGDDVYRSYSTAYVFGAFLLRNFGGADLLHELMQNNAVDEQSVVDAVNQVNGVSLTFADILRRWGVAVLLSDTTAPLPLGIGPGYNSGGAFDYAFNGQQYKLGSMNLHLYSHYNFDTGNWSDVLRVFSLSEYPSTIEQAANVFTHAGGIIAGQTESWEFDVPSGVSVTAVIRAGE